MGRALTGHSKWITALSWEPSRVSDTDNWGELGARVQSCTPTRAGERSLGTGWGALTDVAWQAGKVVCTCGWGWWVLITGPESHLAAPPDGGVRETVRSVIPSLRAGHPGGSVGRQALPAQSEDRLFLSSSSVAMWPAAPGPAACGSGTRPRAAARILTGHTQSVTCLRWGGTGFSAASQGPCHQSLEGS